MKVIVHLNPDGTAAVTTPIAQPGESEADALARTLADHPGGEPLSAELARGLIASAQPTPTGTVAVGRVRAALSLMAVRLPTLESTAQPVWGSLVDRLTALLPTEYVAVTDLTPVVQAAQGAGLLTPAEASALLGVDS